MSSWSIQLKFLQVMLIWLASAGLMVAVFLFGLFAGREQGIQYALAGQDDSSLRLPLSIEQSEINREINGDTNNQLPSESSSDSSVTEAKAGKAPDSRAGLKKPDAPKKPAKKVVKKPKAGEANVPKKLAKSETDKKAAKKPTAKKATKEKEKAKKAPEKKQAGITKAKPGWYIQVLAANTEREAKKIVDKLSKKGFQSSVQTASVKKIKYYRVLVGPYASKSKANKKKSTISSLKIVPSTPFVKRIK